MNRLQSRKSATLAGAANHNLDAFAGSGMAAAKGGGLLSGCKPWAKRVIDWHNKTSARTNGALLAECRLMARAARGGRSALTVYGSKNEPAVIGPFGKRLARSMAITFALFAAPSFALGQDASSCLIANDAVNHALGENPETLPEGLGSFHLPDLGAAGLTVHYARPPSFTSSSPILLVIPGAGRNSDDYRDAWIDAACASGTLVAALGYSEENYDFAAYNMGGTISNLQFDNPSIARVTETATTLTLDDADIRFEVVTNRPDWIFGDFDRVFEQLVQKTDSEQETYDIFGHSAGGQILHRFAIFAPQSKARVIIAANSGFYTFPDLSQPLPTGIKGTGLTETDLSQAYGSQLVLMLGELDNDDQAGGTLLHTPHIDGSQGLGRLDRGRRFHEHARDEAERIEAAFDWQVQVIDGIGHDYRAMSAAAAEYLMNLPD